MFFRLELGYVYTKEGEMISVSSINLPLWQHGENGTPPTDYAFSFIAGILNLNQIATKKYKFIHKMKSKVGSKNFFILQVGRSTLLR